MTNFNSHKTAITRTSPSAPMRYLHEKGLLKGRVLDYGCGKGFDADFYNLERYDPYYSPQMPEGKFDTIVCNYVLNTVDQTESHMILQDIESRLKRKGNAYITVRRDVKKDGFTSRKTFQRNVFLNYSIIQQNSSSCIYHIPFKGKLIDLPIYTIVIE